MKVIPKQELNKAMLKMAVLKLKVKRLTQNLDKIQDAVLGLKKPPTEFETPQGTLKLQSRKNATITDITGVFEKIGKSSFLEICSIPVGKLKKLIGEGGVSNSVGFRRLEALKMIKEGNPTKYYILFEKKAGK